MTFLDDPRLYTGVEGDEQRAARRELVERLLAAGATQERVLEAVENERLAVLPAELVLEGEAPYTLTEVARQSRLDPAFLRQILLAMGRPNPLRGEKAFTDADVQSAHILRAFRDAGLPRAGMVHVARVLGQSTTTTAYAIRQLVADAFLKRGVSEAELALQYEQAASQLGPLVGPLLGHELIVHIREAIRREAVTQAEREAGTIRGTRPAAVGFCDMVGFTKLGAELPPDELGGIADRLAEIATAVAVSPVRLVKMIGDEAMLVAPEPAHLLDAIVEVMRRAAEDSKFPTLRAGIAYGQTVSQAGDWYGAPVNLASRLTAVAKPGTIAVDEAAREWMPDELPWSRSKRKGLKGVGKVTYYRLAPESVE